MLIGGGILNKGQSAVLFYQSVPPGVLLAAAGSYLVSNVLRYAAGVSVCMAFLCSVAK